MVAQGGRGDALLVKANGLEPIGWSELARGGSLVVVGWVATPSHVLHGASIGDALVDLAGGEQREIVGVVEL